MRRDTPDDNIWSTNGYGPRKQLQSRTKWTRYGSLQVGVWTEPPRTNRTIAYVPISTKQHSSDQANARAGVLRIGPGRLEHARQCVRCLKYALMLYNEFAYATRNPLEVGLLTTAATDTALSSVER